MLKSKNLGYDLVLQYRRTEHRYRQHGPHSGGGKCDRFLGKNPLRQSPGGAGPACSAKRSLHFVHNLCLVWPLFCDLLSKGKSLPKKSTILPRRYGHRSWQPPISPIHPKILFDSHIIHPNSYWSRSLTFLLDTRALYYSTYCLHHWSTCIVIEFNSIKWHIVKLNHLWNNKLRNPEIYLALSIDRLKQRLALRGNSCGRKTSRRHSNFAWRN